MLVPIQWHGTTEEYSQLAAAVNQNCACDPDHQFTCRAHWMLDNDQRAADGLLFVCRYLKIRLEREEFMGEAHPDDQT